jgi:peptidyl-prolyl cis-trans isomerase SurA
MTTRRRIALALWLGCLIAGTGRPVSAQETRIAAIVNDDVISINDLNARMRLVTRTSEIDDTPEGRQRMAPQVLRALVDEKLENQEAKRLGIKASETDLSEAVRRIEQQNNMPAGGLNQYLTRIGVETGTLTDQLSAQIIWSRLVRRKFNQNLQVAEEEIDDALAQLKSVQNEPLSRVAEIFLSVDNPAQEEDVRANAQRLIEQMRGGAKFSAIARQFSQSATAAVGGDAGWVARGQLDSAVEAVVDKMRPGELSMPIRTTGGFYLILLLDRRLPSQAASGDTVIDLTQVVVPVSAGSTPEQRRAIADRLRAITAEARSCGEMAKIGREQAPQLSGNLGKVKVGDLPQPLQPVMLALQTAQPSEPVDVPGGLASFMICERQDPPSTTPVRTDIADNIARQRFDIFARRYLRDLRRAAYIDLRL